MVYCILHTAFPQNCLLVLIQELFSFSVLDVALTILEPLGPTSPLDHGSGVPERYLEIFSFCLWNYCLLADVSNEVMTPFCVLDMASRGCKRLFLFDLIQHVLHLSHILGICCVILSSGSGLFPSAQCCHLRNFLID